MSPQESRTDVVDEAAAIANGGSTLPYDIRAEIDWVDFSCTDNPLGTPQPITDAITHAIAEGDLSYTPNHDGTHLANMMARYHELPAEAFMVGTSVSSMVASIAQAFRPCNVGIPTPAPAEFFLAVANVGHNPVRLPNYNSLSSVEPATARSNGIQFEAAVLANPSYPCARMLSEETLIQYLETCNWVIVDESNVNLTLSAESFIDLTQTYRNLFVVRSISAEFGIPGVPMGYVVGHPDAIKHARQFNDGTAVGMFHEVVARALPKCAEYQEQTTQLLDNEIPWMQVMLSLTPGMKVFPSEANFVMCALEQSAARNFGLSSAADLVTRLQKVGYTVRDLADVPGIEDTRYFLVSIRTHEENEAFLQKLRAVITE